MKKQFEKIERFTTKGNDPLTVYGFEFTTEEGDKCIFTGVDGYDAERDEYWADYKITGEIKV
jgi:hypothetical protein